MKQTLTFSHFHDAFQNIRPDNFSYEGLRVLFDFFEEYDESCDTETELDVVAICCEFNESTIDEFFDQYDIDMTQFDDERDAIEWYLSENGTSVGWVNIPDNGWNILYQQF